MSVEALSRETLIRLHASDNVLVALEPIAKGVEVASGVIARDDIPALHKIAAQDIAVGEAVLKYGQRIGEASNAIAAGEHVHVHNCEMIDAAQDYRFSTSSVEAVPVAASEQLTFEGFRRADGRVGTRNYIAIVSSVNCSATVAHAIARHFDRVGLEDYPTVDGVAAFTYSGGCSISPAGDAYKVLQRTLAGYARNPNVGAVLLVGLGCESMQLARLMEDYNLNEGPALKAFTIQDEGGTKASIAAGIAAVEELLYVAGMARRETVSASELVLGLQCGGSDGLSGITANPALGVAVDLLAAQGGTAILSETTELYGAEHLLTERARTPEIGHRLIERIEWWRDYTARNGETINSNPSPGNKAGGITTILEKSLGAQSKGGSTSVNAIYQYAEPITEKGLVIMDSPGYDPCSATGQIASGANLICFTTGRGSAFGSKPAPTIKLATNTPMFEKQRDDMDINCGDIVSEGVSIETKGKEILELILAVASGKATASEELGYGDNEFVPWNIGPTT